MKIYFKSVKNIILKTFSAAALLAVAIHSSNLSANYYEEVDNGSEESYEASAEDSERNPASIEHEPHMESDGAAQMEDYPATEEY